MDTTVMIGASAERSATQLVLDKGYAIVERNFRCKAGEIDIVAQRGGLLVFVEVRSRGDAAHGSAAETVDRRKQRQVARVAAWFLAERDPAYTGIRFDVIALTGREVVWFEDAFRPGLP